MRSHPDIRAPGQLDAHDQTMRHLHVSDVDIYVLLPIPLAQRAVQRLVTCHQHVFVVDQTFAHTGEFGVGVSGAGAKCLREEFPEVLAPAST